MVRLVLTGLIFPVCLMLVGCGDSATPVGEKKETSGKVTLKGQPLSGVKLVLQPLGDGAEAYAVTGQDGAFKTSATPGQYAWYFYAKDGTPASAAALRKVPEDFRSGKMDRKVSVGGSDLNIDVK